MIDEGVAAPTFELPALVDGVHRRVSLEEYLGDDVIILAFYPGDFNPACDEESDLDELDLFTMQKDVTVLGIGPDTLFAHEAFAERYDLHIPLLSDTRRAVAEQYDLTFEDETGQDLVERAVFVIDHDGEVEYAWSTRDMTQLPITEAIKDAIGETGGDETAFARYRVGHAHYVEGRRAFTSAMGAFSKSEWMIAQSDFQRAREEFTEGADHFDSAVRFVDDDLFEEHYAAAEEKATLLWQAADWLTQAASHYSSGRGAEGQRLRDDAERPLEEARTMPEPIDPDDWPPETPPEKQTPDEVETFVPDSDEDQPTAALDVDLDEESAQSDDVDVDDTAEDEDAEDDIDDEELAEIEAELAEAPSDDPVEDGPDERQSVIDHAPGENESDGEDGTPANTGPEGPANETEPPSGDQRSPSAANGAGADTVGEAPEEEITDDDLAELGAEIAASDPTDDATEGDEEGDADASAESDSAEESSDRAESATRGDTDTA